MNNFFNKLQPYAPFVLRIGMAFVFLYFGLSQITAAGMWTSLIPAWFASMTGSATNAVYLNGIAEVILAALILFNIWTRYVALLLFLHLLSIVGILGINPVGVRDIGLAFACLTLGLWGKEAVHTDTGVSGQNTSTKTY